jgi:hypothetical protein
MTSAVRCVNTCVVFFLLGAAFAVAQETRGNISGTVADSQGGAIARASVTVRSLDTRVTSQIKTNGSGYYLASLLIPGNYEVIVEAPGFKRSIRSGLILAVGQQMDLHMTLEVGGVNESVTVVGESPLLDTSSVTVGQNIDRRSVDAMPVFADMTILMSRFMPGVGASAVVQYVNQGYASRTSDDTASLIKVGGNEWTIDGATNGGDSRRLATSPIAEMIQEVRVETANFDASFGHATGIGVSIMTRTGANDLHGSGTWLYWNNRLNSPHLFQRQVYYRNIANALASGNTAQANSLASQSIMAAGFSKSLNLTLGGPVYIPKVINGKNKLFFFVNFGWNRELRIGANASGINTVPTAANRAGDFSALLNVNAQYQVYDPLSVRVDPARAGHYIRTPFSGNILPSSRINNPMYQFYLKRIPASNADPLVANQEPLNNYRTSGDPDPITNEIFGNRIDYNLSGKHRFFFRVAKSHFTEGLGDWTWETDRGLMSSDTVRKPFSGTFDWTFTKDARTVISTQISANRYYQGSATIVAAKYKPTDVGLPAYLDQKCIITACTMPSVSWSGYSGLGQAAPSALAAYNRQGTLNVTQVFGQHTLRYGADIRQHLRTSTSPGASAGSFAFDNLYTRKNDDTAVAPAGSLGLSWAAFALGVPSASSIAENDSHATTSPYYAGYVQNAWRATRALTLNFGLRFEFEQGITERYDRMLVGWDPALKLKITDAAMAAYAAAPLAEVPASAFSVLGGSLYANSQGQGRRAWKSQAMFLPRVAFAWQFNPKTVVRGGYGIYYDSLNATNQFPNQLGYSTTTTNVASNDFGSTWNSGNPAAGISMLTDPFPIRADGSRYETPYRNALGAMMVAGTSYTYGNLQQEHASVQRWRAGIQRELTRNMSLELAYSGMYSGNAGLNVRQDVLAGKYWNTTQVRNSALASDLNSNVTNPFYIGNFASLQTSDPQLYSRLSSVSFFTSKTVAKNRLLRPFPQMTALTAANLPMMKARVHSLDMTIQRRFASGLSLNAALSLNQGENWSTILNEYDQAPTQWIPSNDSRPYRLTAYGLYELPFGKGRSYLQHGVLSAITGGWQVSSTFEWQPGPLLVWNNLFFNGNLNDIKADSTISRWFNTDAGFEKAPAKVPAAFQSRVFPTIVDGVRADKSLLLNASVQRSFRIKERFRLEARVDAANALNRSHFGNPNLDPTSTQFGVVTQTSGTICRWLTFVGKVTF